MPANLRFSLPLVVLMAVAPFGTSHAVIMASISGCDANSCTVTPNGGPVAVDPTGFVLDVDWSPEHIELIEPLGDRGEWLLQLTFNVAGTPDGTEHFGDITLNEMNGVPIGPLNEQFDDQNSIGLPTLVANYEIFGPDLQATFFAHGFTLEQSSVAGEPNDPITGLEWISARVSVRQGAIDRGIWVPEPISVSLLPFGFAAMYASRRRKATTI